MNKPWMKMPAAALALLLGSTALLHAQAPAGADTKSGAAPAAASPGVATGKVGAEGAGGGGGATRAGGGDKSGAGAMSGERRGAAGGAGAATSPTGDAGMRRGGGGGSEPTVRAESDRGGARMDRRGSMDRPSAVRTRVDVRSGAYAGPRRSVTRVVVRDRPRFGRRIVMRGPACTVRIVRTRTAFGVRVRKIRVCRR
ncbi:hypothetical protein [uncultured Enterovirga sp.]|uniref:hypothetical protein n=1 Tax=uncultured Enterovirga sp. TaxID=2026352 RepID=UPI0035C9ABA1